MSIDFETLETPAAEQADVGTRYHLAVVHAARTGDMAISSDLLEEAGRFLIDFQADVALMRKRLDAAAQLEDARRRLAELERNVLPPRAKASDLVADVGTLGELLLALEQLKNPHTQSRVEVDHHGARSDAVVARKRAESMLRHTSSKALQDEIGQCHNAIAKRREAVAARAKLEEKLADLEKQVARRPVTEEQKGPWLTARQELVRLRSRLRDEPAPDPDDSDLRAKLESLAAKQLDPLAVEFLPPQREPVLDFTTPQG